RRPYTRRTNRLRSSTYPPRTTRVEVHARLLRRVGPVCATGNTLRSDLFPLLFPLHSLMPSRPTARSASTAEPALGTPGALLPEQSHRPNPWMSRHRSRDPRRVTRRGARREIAGRRMHDERVATVLVQTRRPAHHVESTNVVRPQSSGVPAWRVPREK